MGTKKGDLEAVEVTPQRGLANHKLIIARRTFLRQARKFIIHGLVFVSLLGIFAACSTENLKVSLILAIPSLIYLGLYVWVNNI